MTSHPSLDSTPPPEPFKQWEDDILNNHENVDLVLDTTYRAGFNAGADQELDACVKWLNTQRWEALAIHLRAARRPKPPSLKEQALEELGQISISPELGITVTALDTIRRALETLPND